MPNMIMYGKVHELNCPECMKLPWVKQARVDYLASLRMWPELVKETKRQATFRGKR